MKIIFYFYNLYQIIFQINWSKERYDAIVLKLKVFMAKQAGFKVFICCYILVLWLGFYVTLKASFFFVLNCKGNLLSISFFYFLEKMKSAENIIPFDLTFLSNTNKYYKLLLFLIQESDVSYVPCSGLSGENLTEKAKESSLIEWYKGESLVDKIGELQLLEIYKQYIFYWYNLPLSILMFSRNFDVFKM